MNNLRDSSSGRRVWLDAGATARLLFLALLAFASPATLSASELRSLITLMPTLTEDGQSKTAEIAAGTFCPDRNSGCPKQIHLRFQTTSLPAEATVTAARLSLVSSKSASAIQTVRVHYDTGAACTASSKALQFNDANGKFPKDSRVNWDVSHGLNNLSSERSPFSLCLTSQSNAKSSWYLASDKSSYRPRLILEYSLPYQPAVTQSNGLPAVQSAEPFRPTRDGEVSDQFSYVTRSFPNAWSYTPAFYDQQVYLVTSDTDKNKQLQALNPLGSPIRPPVPLDGTPGQHLLVSKLGRLYIVGNESIFVHQLYTGKPAQSLTTQLTASCDPNLKPCEVKSPGLSPSVAPSVGPAGSLYFVNGLEVYGLNPDLQELWKVKISASGGEGSTSRVTVGPSGRFVYLTTRDYGLVAINAQTGETVMKVLPNQDTLRAADSPALHAPVVIRHPDGSEKIYAAANSVNGGVLACFTNRNNVLLGTTARNNGSNAFKAADLVACEHGHLPGLWSQPIPDPLSPGSGEPNVEKRIYAVRVDNGLGSLKAIDWLSGLTEDMTPTFAVAAKPEPYLLNGGNLAMDMDGNTFIWNGAGDIGLYVLRTLYERFDTTTPKGVLDGPLKLLGGIPVNAQLLFGSDGTLYANDVDGRVLMVIVPQVELSPVFTGSISSPTNLRVVGTASNKTVKTVLKAEGSVLLGPGFTVKRGAKLTIGTP